jgi:putative transposase
VLGEYQRSYLEDDDYEKRMGTLHYSEENDAFSLHVVIQKEVKYLGDKPRGFPV